jgi:acyl-CoA dehydrogenase
VSDLSAFAEDVSVWLERNCPTSQRQPAKSEELVYGGRNCVFPSDDAKLWLGRMADKGWTVPTWPKEYGGAGLTAAEDKVLKKAMKKLSCRSPLTGHGLWMLGPALLEFGSEQQKLEHLPKIARGEIRWCQGYSEPGAGSDLASLRCKCEDRGDHFLVNGQKSWTTDGNKSDWVFTLVRTDFEAAKQQQGISFLLIDMASKGVEVRPVALLNGNDDFCDTFFDNVKVPKENLVFELNQGWSVAKALLVHERTMMSQIQDYAPRLPYSVVEYAKRYVGINEQGKIADPLLRDRLTEHLMNTQAMGLSHRRAFEEGMAGSLDKRSLSYFKAYATEEDKNRDELLLALLGSQGLGWEGDGFSDDELMATRQFLMNKALSIGGGTTEVQLNLIAKQLGLPA